MDRSRSCCSAAYAPCSDIVRLLIYPALKHALNGAATAYKRRLTFRRYLLGGSARRVARAARAGEEPVRSRGGPAVRIPFAPAVSHDQSRRAAALRVPWGQKPAMAALPDKRGRSCPLPGTKSACLGRNQAARSGPIHHHLATTPNTAPGHPRRRPEYGSSGARGQSRSSSGAYTFGGPVTKIGFEPQTRASTVVGVFAE